LQDLSKNSVIPTVNRKENILLAFYGDDLTGSTDALEFICRAGAKALLFLKPPTAAQLKAFPGLQAFGVAGRARSLSPEMMEAELLPAFNLMKETGAKHVHYKICSTFDSSPQTGSIGKAIECGATVFQTRLIPVLGGMPALGRYCLFGNLFAQMGIGSEGEIYRLDRHPSMRKHPITPANESDLRIHLGSQTKKKIGLINVLEMEGNINTWLHSLKGDEEAVLLDVLNNEQLTRIGEWLSHLRKEDETLFCVGSSGIEMALGSYWNQIGALKARSSWLQPEKTKPLLVVSGSCSPVTTTQIEYAKANGFEEIVIDAKKVSVEKDIIQRTVKILQQGKNLIVHTGERETEAVPSEITGKVLGSIAREAIIITGLKRVIVAGGDTSSHAAGEMEIDALEMIAPMVSGAPLCKVYSRNKSIDGIEINFKGGQVGGKDYLLMFANT
jgi:3-oxoisoapionate kinase